MFREDLNGKIALITGASNGIGRATARLLADKGATVVVGYHSGRERAEEVCVSLPNSGHFIFQIDIKKLHPLGKQPQKLGDVSGN